MGALIKNEKPILFNGEMVRAILDGRKTQTRRLLKPEQVPHLSPSEIEGNNEFPEMKYISIVQSHPRWGFAAFGETEEKCAQQLLEYGGSPYRKGQKLWVRETHSIVPKTAYWHTPETPHRENGDHWAVYREGWDRSAPRWKPSIHMPRWASRITLEVKSVRVERLQDISEDDAKAEGFTGQQGEARFYHNDEISAFAHFRETWQSIYGNWKSNPWVWVVEFEVVKP